jgi:serine/threonine protein kinase
MMDNSTFLEHYRICTNDDGSVREVARSGPAIIYKAIDQDSDQLVALQLVPIGSIDEAKREQVEQRAQTAQQIRHVNVARTLAAGIERDYFVLVSEYLNGDTADAWVAAHGPMPPPAVLRVGIQVLRAIAAGAFHGLIHAAVQPSNIMIVPGQTEDGGWPAKKLLHLDLAGIERDANEDDRPEIAPSAAPEFASPEQLLNRKIDFRSEIYSLGASMCFLLTGAVPLTASGMKARLRLSRLPELRRAPRVVRTLLAGMLRERPEKRPQDPVALEVELHKCLAKTERREAIRRRLGIPLAAVVRKDRREQRSPLAEIWRGVVAVGLLLVVGAAVGAFLFPERVPFFHRTTEIGVPVGVPEGSNAASVQSSNVAPIAATGPTTNGAPAPANPNEKSSPDIQPPQTSTAQLPVTDHANAAPKTVNSSAQVASAATASTPAPPSEGLDERAADAENSEQTRNNESAETTDAERSATTNRPVTRSKEKEDDATPTRKSTAKRPRVRRALPVEEDAQSPSLGGGSMRAEVVGTTPDGRLILRLPSGRTVFVRPRSDDEGNRVPRRRRRVWVERPETVLPAQPVDPGYLDND